MADKAIEYFELDPSIEYIKIHGLQRSGTNYLAHLVNENFEKTKVLVNLGGWKHGHYNAPWFIGKEVHVLGIVKNPYSWLVSMFKYWGPTKKLRIGPDLNGVSFEDFVKNRVYFEAQRDIPFLFRASNPVQHWNDMNFHWTTIRMNQKILTIISYENLLANPKDTVQMIGERFGLHRKSQFVGCDKKLEPAGENLRPGEESWVDKGYYQNQEFLQQYTPELIEFVNDELDLDLMVHFGYDFVSPDEVSP